MLENTLSSARDQVDRCVDDVTSFARREPGKALLSALAGGYLLRMLPVTRILGVLLGLALVILKPAALIYGVATLWRKTRDEVPNSSRDQLR